MISCRRWQGWFQYVLGSWCYVAWYILHFWCLIDPFRHIGAYMCYLILYEKNACCLFHVKKLRNGLAQIHILLTRCLCICHTHSNECEFWQAVFFMIQNGAAGMKSMVPRGCSGDFEKLNTALMLQIRFARTAWAHSDFRSDNSEPPIP